jgi:hypothetical protein
MTIIPGSLLAADWGKESKKRAVYLADVARRAIERIDFTDWNLERLLTVARGLVRSGRGPVVLSLDLVLGVPETYFRQVQGIDRWKHVRNFIDWLPLVGGDEAFWQITTRANEWNAQRPFFAVPKGKGTLNAFYEQAGYNLRRKVDVRCHSKCPFKGVADCRADKVESTFLQILAHLLRFRRKARNIFHRLPSVLYRITFNKSPNVFIKGTELFLDLKKCFGVLYSGFDFQSVAYDTCIRH